MEVEGSSSNHLFAITIKPPLLPLRMALHQRNISPKLWREQGDACLDLIHRYQYTSGSLKDTRKGSL